MLESLKIENYRGLKDLERSRLGRINLIAGKNNSGKTTLLEALFLLSGGGNAELAARPFIVRDLRGMAVGLPQARAIQSDMIWENWWKPLFHGFDTERPIRISGAHKTVGNIALEITQQRQEVTDIPLSDHAADHLGRRWEADMMDNRKLLFQFTDSSGETYEGWLQVSNRGMEGILRLQRNAARLPFHTAFAAAKFSGANEAAERLAELRKRKQSDLLVEALKVIEPRIKSIEDNSASGVPVVLCDLGYSELVPLSAAGEGMVRLAQLVLAIASVPKGIVLVDEVENGFHHTALPKIWKVIGEVSKQLEVQVFATTHSYECIRAAGIASNDWDSDDLLAHRIETDAETNGGANRHVIYEPENIAAALDHNLEIR